MTPVPWMHAFIDVPAEYVEPARAFWSAATGWSPSGAWTSHPEFVSLLPADGAPYLHLQTIDGPPRVHLDLVGDIARSTDRLRQLGATPTYRGDWWQAMSSPAGLPFCVCADPPSRRPEAATWPGGYRSRLVQLCIDVPPWLYDAELSFWRAATGWADEPVNAPEFHRLVHRAESPLQLLVQRLGSDDGATHARAHLDLGSDDRSAEIARVEALGARLLWHGDGFSALRDPVGQLFCVTDNDPHR